MKLVLPSALYIFVTSILFTSCVSAEKYNTKRAQVISVKKLQKDINYVQKNLYKRHPDYDYYTSKPTLDKRFDSLRTAIVRPLNSHDFYLAIAPVIASVHQGHMGIIPAARKVDRERKKQLKKLSPNPLSQFDYKWEDDKLYVTDNRSKDSSIKVGAQLIAINQIPVEKIYQEYASTLTSDGYNQSGLNMFFAKRVPMFYNEALGPLDSARYQFLIGDSLYTKIIKREAKKEASKLDTIIVKTAPKGAVVLDSLKSDSVIKAKEKEKVVEANKVLYGYDKNKHEFIRELKFYGKDSSVAYLQIKQFMEGRYKKAYSTLFDSIQNAKSKTLILDLRGNPGGKAVEVVDLYAYFVDTSFKMYSPNKVASKTSLMRAGLFRSAPKFAWPFLGLFYPYYAGSRFFQTHKYKDGNYYYTGLKGNKWIKPNEKNFKGKIYLLVDGGSFSAACLLASRMAILPNVTIVGEETGGDFNGTVAGVLPMVKLPKSKLIWRLGLMHIRPVNKTPRKGRGIFPEKNISVSIKDMMVHQDPAINWILMQEQINAEK